MASSFDSAPIVPPTLSVESTSSSVNCAPIGLDFTLYAQLEALKLKSKDPSTHFAVDRVLESLADIIQTNMLATVADVMSTEQEARLWSCFAEVYKKETELQQQEAGKALSIHKKRQVFADILVWAEVTAQGYDKAAASFITGPHAGDASFQRIGSMLAIAKAACGLASA